MQRRSAGLLMYRRQNLQLEVFLVHPGGPFWAKKDLGAWSVPKGGYEDDEPALDAARREFQEETGFAAEGTFRSWADFRDAVRHSRFRRGRVSWACWDRTGVPRSCVAKSNVGSMVRWLDRGARSGCTAGVLALSSARSTRIRGLVRELYGCEGRLAR